MTLAQFYTSVEEALKLKVRKCWGLILTFVQITGEKLVEETFLTPPPPILNRVKILEINGSSHNITIMRNTLTGDLESVKSIVPLEVRQVIPQK